MASEYGEDLWIEQNVTLPAHGFYLDLGCAWPGMYSNTEFLRKRGWPGLAVDGNPAYADNWRGVERFLCAVIGDGEPLRFLCHDAPDLSRVSPEGAVRLSTPLRQIVETLPPIDFISCDLEGHEFDALSTFDFGKHRPKVIISECSTYGIGEDFRVCDLLAELGYRIAHKTVANHVFTI